MRVAPWCGWGRRYLVGEVTHKKKASPLEMPLMKWPVNYLESFTDKLK